MDITSKAKNHDLHYFRCGYCGYCGSEKELQNHTQDNCGDDLCPECKMKYHITCCLTKKVFESY